MVKITEPKLFTRGVKLWVRFSLNGEVIKQSLNIEDTKANRNFENKIVPTVKDMISMSLKMNKANRKYLTQRSYEMLLNRHVLPYYSASKISLVYWEKALKSLNLVYRNLYQMRHTFASMMISSGEDILWVSSMLGHKNSSITLSVDAKHIKTTKKSRGTFLLN